MDTANPVIQSRSECQLEAKVRADWECLRNKCGDWGKCTPPYSVLLLMNGLLRQGGHPRELTVVKFGMFSLGTKYFICLEACALRASFSSGTPVF